MCASGGCNTFGFDSDIISTELHNVRQSSGNAEPLKSSNVLEIQSKSEPLCVWSGVWVVNISTGLFLDQCFQASFWRTNFMIYSDTKQSAMFARQWQGGRSSILLAREKDNGALQWTRLVDERNGQHRQKLYPGRHLSRILRNLNSCLIVDIKSY